MKTLDKIKRVRILISNNFKNEISYRSMKKILDSEKIHEMLNANLKKMVK